MYRWSEPDPPSRAEAEEDKPTLEELRAIPDDDPMLVAIRARGQQYQAETAAMHRRARRDA